MRKLLIGLLTLTSVAAIAASPYANECSNTAIAAAIGAEYATIEGEGSVLQGKLTGVSKDIKQKEFESIIKVVISNTDAMGTREVSTYKVTIGKIRSSETSPDGTSSPEVVSTCTTKSVLLID